MRIRIVEWMRMVYMSANQESAFSCHVTLPKSTSRKYSQPHSSARLHGLCDFETSSSAFFDSQGSLLSILAPIMDHEHLYPTPGLGEQSSTDAATSHDYTLMTSEKDVGQDASASIDPAHVSQDNASDNSCVRTLTISERFRCTKILKNLEAIHHWIWSYETLTISITTGCFVGALTIMFR